jgi:two-component system response regulator PilR (NtrC family)
MMTAFANVDTAREAFLLGAYDFVQKPFDNDLLKEPVARALRKIHSLKKKKRCSKRTRRSFRDNARAAASATSSGAAERMLALYQMIETGRAGAVDGARHG